MTALKPFAPTPPSRSSARQHGVSLIIVLMFLVAITGISLWAARYSMMSEGMARNEMDREAARQAAESALRDAERDIMNITATTLPNASCTRARTRPPIATDFSANCAQGLCVRPEADYVTLDWTKAAGDKTLAEYWWPKSKNGSWNDDKDSKPGRAPVSATNCNSFTGGVPLGTYTGVPVVGGVTRQPEYLVERFNKISGLLKKPTEVYRITARGYGYSIRTQVVLQTIFVPMQED